MIDYHKFFAARQFSKSTETAYRFSLDRFVFWANKSNARPDSMECEMFQEFLDSQETWNHNSRYSAYCALRSYLRWKYGEHHPALAFKLKRKDTEPQRALDIDQLRAVMGTFTENTPENTRNKAMIALMVDTGLRASEVCGLKLRHLHLKTNSCKAIIKGGRWEEAVYSDKTTECLKTWLGLRETLLHKMGMPDPETVFIGIKGHTPGKSLTAHGLRDIFQKIGERAGLEEGFSPHDLRRTFATISLRNGANTRLVQVAGRWRDIRLVERYSAHITARDMTPYFPMRDIE